VNLYYLQRREFYRLETPITQSPTCKLPIPGDPDEEPCELEFRVLDISAGGMAIAMAVDMPLLALRRTYPDCVLTLPDQPPICLSLTVCSQLRQTMPGGTEYIRRGHAIWRPAPRRRHLDPALHLPGGPAAQRHQARHVLTRAATPDSSLAAAPPMLSMRTPLSEGVDGTSRWRAQVPTTIRLRLWSDQ